MNSTVNGPAARRQGALTIRPALVDLNLGQVSA
jgi:hypothetical protein